MSKKYYHEQNSLSTRVGNFPAHKARRLDDGINTRQLSTAGVRGLGKFTRAKGSNDRPRGFSGSSEAKTRNPDTPASEK